MEVYLIEENARQSPLFVAQAPGPDDVVAQIIPGVDLPQLILCLQQAGADLRYNCAAESKRLQPTSSSPEESCNLRHGEVRGRVGRG